MTYSQQSTHAIRINVLYIIDIHNYSINEIFRNEEVRN